MTPRPRFALVPLLALGLLAACGDDETPPVVADSGPEADADVSDDITPTPDEDTTPDVDVDDATPEVTPPTDVTPDEGPDADVEPSGPCGDELPCLDPRTGNPNVTICRSNDYPVGTLCQRLDESTACCVPPFRCSTDDDCEEARDREGFCDDDRFPCVCAVATGACSLSVCTADTDCASGSSCEDGRCVVDDGNPSDFVGRTMTATTWVVAGSTVVLEGVAVDASNPSRTRRNLPLTWTVEPAGGATLAGASVTLAMPGTYEATVRVTGNASDPGDRVTLHAIEPGNATTVRIVLVDEATRTPVEGVLVTRGTEDEPLVSDADGRVAFDVDAGATFDVHAFSEGHAYVSVVGTSSRTLLVALPPIQRAEIREERDGFVCDTERPGVTLDDTACGGAGAPPCMCYDLRNIDVVRGRPDFSEVRGNGEIEVTLGGFSLGNAILDLNFDLIVGPQIRREIPPNPVINLDDPVDIPSGVTLYLNGQPFVDSFIGTAPAGRRTAWSVGGTMPLGETLRILLPSLSGSLDFGPIIAALLPLFSDFYSGVTAPLELAPEGTFPVRDPGLRLEVPTQRRVAVTSPQLPRVGTGWSDTALFLGGAMVPGEGFVPLGISGGTDVLGRGTPDGFIDGNHDTPAVDPITLAMAPIHGSIAAPGTRYAFASVALTLGTRPPEAPGDATAGIITVLPAGEPLPSTLPYGEATYPPLAVGSAWRNGDGERTLVLEGPADAYDLFRVVFQGNGDRQWVVYAEGESAEYALPTVPEREGFDDPAQRGRVNVVAVRLRSPSSIDYRTILGAQGSSLLDLFVEVEGFSILGL